MTLRARLAKLEAVVAPEETGAVAQVARFMVHLWGEDWPSVMAQLTAERCTPGGDACWACDSLRWTGHVPSTRARSEHERSARLWTERLTNAPSQPERPMPQMSPFFGVDVHFQWKRFIGQGETR